MSLRPRGSVFQSREPKSRNLECQRLEKRPAVKNIMILATRLPVLSDLHRSDPVKLEITSATGAL